MGLSLLSYSQQTIIFIMYVFLVKDDLVLIYYLGTHDIALNSFASAQHEI
jgi:hypothetical protein